METMTRPSMSERSDERKPGTTLEQGLGSLRAGTMPNPPEAHRFKKGQSGNPGGWPKKSKEVKQIEKQLNALLTETALVEYIRKDLKVVVDRFFEIVKNPRPEDRAAVQAALGLIAHSMGKPKVKVEVSGDTGLTEAKLVAVFGAGWLNAGQTFEDIKRAIEREQARRRGERLGAPDAGADRGPAVGMPALPLGDEREGVLPEATPPSPSESEARPDDPGGQPVWEVNVGEPGDIVDVAWKAFVPGDPEAAGDSY
jgi:Family of unknown function (DUF5681)